MSEPLMRLLAELPTAEVESQCAERIRSRCRARLVRHAPSATGSTIAFTPVWRLLVAVLGAAYLIGAIIEAVRVYRFS